MGNILCGEVTPHVDNKDEAVSMGLIPDVFSQPKYFEKLGKVNLSVQFAWTACRAMMRPADCVRAPEICTSLPLDATALYTLLMFDPDAPCRTRPIYRSFFHHLIIDIPGKQTGEGKSKDKFGLKNGREVMQYVGPAPPCNSGPHRYVYMLFKQTEALGNFFSASQDLRTFIKDGPGKLGVQDFVAKFKLEPQAIHIFQASWDESCDKTHADIGFTPADEFKSPVQKKAARDIAALKAKKEAEEKEATKKAAAAAAANQEKIAAFKKGWSDTFSIDNFMSTAPAIKEDEKKTANTDNISKNNAAVKETVGSGKKV